MNYISTELTIAGKPLKAEKANITAECPDRNSEVKQSYSTAKKLGRNRQRNSTHNCESCHRSSSVNFGGSKLTWGSKEVRKYRSVAIPPSYNTQYTKLFNHYQRYSKRQL